MSNYERNYRPADWPVKSVRDDALLHSLEVVDLLNQLDEEITRLKAQEGQSRVERDIEVVEHFCAWLKANWHLDKSTCDGAVAFIEQLRRSGGIA